MCRTIIYSMCSVHNIEGSNGLENGPRTMEFIHSYSSPPNALRQELMKMMMVMMTTTTTTRMTMTMTINDDDDDDDDDGDDDDDVDDDGGDSLT